MIKAVVLLVGVSIYVWFLQTGKTVAEREMAHVQNLYTYSIDHPDAILSSNR